MNLILGAGLAGLSCSYHLGHQNCLLLEKKGYPFGHIHTEFRDGFTWDEGPHVSFTKHDYVRELFADSVNGEFEEYPVRTGNYFRGLWIDHPAQSNLYQVPEPLRTQCLDSFLTNRDAGFSTPSNYAEWLEQAFGSVFAETFPAAYTRKYWTREPRDLTTEWVGGRVFQPAVDDVIAGSRGPLNRQTHYITHVRYPSRGGYQSFAAKLAKGARIAHGEEVVRIDLSQRRLWTTDGRDYTWQRLFNTLPLPIFIAACVDVPASVIEASMALACSSVLLINAIAKHPTAREENWMYVYDEDKHSTRINCTEKLARGNAPEGHTGVQVEVYASRTRPFNGAPDEIGKTVCCELQEMGVMRDDHVRFHSHLVPWANVIFDHDTRPALDIIWTWLETKGLVREPEDLHPLTDWGSSRDGRGSGCLMMAGRFGQWKYFWTDDCVLRGKELQSAVA